MTTLGIAPLIQNQLQFNLEVPPSVGNFASLPRRPGAIVVEKLGAPASPNAARSPMRFSTISEEDMEVAVRLAKRDLKKKREEIEMEHYLEKMAQRASPKIDSKAEERRKARERLTVSSSKPRVGKQTQTKPKRRTDELRSASSGPRPHSPPTRDTDSYPPKLSQDERTALEIRRLRRELRTYVEEIGKIDGAVDRPEPRNFVEDLTDEEYYSKRKARVLGRATRSTRMVYDLKQQIRAIYDEVRYMEPDAEPRKKSEVIKKLASAHRATVRALQDLIHQLPEAGHDEVGKISVELAQLFQQLTECCHHLEIGESKENLMKVVQERPVVANVWKEKVEGPIEFTHVHKPYRPVEKDDERTLALKEGLSNLLRNRSPEKRVPEASVVIGKKPKVRAPRGMKPKKKAKPSVVINEKPHYTEATIAHRGKQREPVQRSRSRSRSPRRPKYVDVDGIEKLNLGVPNEWAEEAEAAIKHRLAPLLQKAERINAQKSPGSMRGILSEKALDRIESSAGLLVELILEDLCKDTALEMMNLETEEKIENDANLLMKGSELHTIMDQLELMEREEREIRERYNSVKFSDRVYKPTVSLSNTPRTPEPTTLDGSEPLPQSMGSFPARPKLEKSPIIFTNEATSARLRSEKLDQLRNEALKNEFGLLDIPHRQSNLSEEEIEDIHEYRNLRLISQHKREKSCRMMERVADEIMQDLLQSAAEEMMATSSEMDNQLCMQELALGQSLHFSTDTDNILSENFTENDRFEVNFDEDSCMDLHDMINDDVLASHVAKENTSFHGNVSGYRGNETSFHSNDHGRMDEERGDRGRYDDDELDRLGNEEFGRHGNDEEFLSDDEEVDRSHDDEAEDIRRDLDQYDVGHLESVVRESGDQDDSDHSNGPHSNILVDIDELEPIRTSHETEEVETEEEDDDEEEADVEYSSEFVTTTGTGDSTGQDTAR